MRGRSARTALVWLGAFAVTTNAWGRLIQLTEWLGLITMDPLWVMIVVFISGLVGGLLVTTVVAIRVSDYLWPKALAGSCSRCGYDLRGTVGRACPECGEPVPAPPAEARPGA